MSIAPTMRVHKHAQWPTSAPQPHLAASNHKESLDRNRSQVRAVQAHRLARSAELGVTWEWPKTRNCPEIV